MVPHAYEATPVMCRQHCHELATTIEKKRIEYT